MNMFEQDSVLGSFPGVIKQRPRLLVVDDQPLNIQVIHHALGQDCQVLMATSGKQALELCHNHPPDLVLLDVEMPEMDGFEVCQRLKADPTTRHIPVIFVTAHNESDFETKGLELGAVDFISKPVNASVLRARVKSHLLLKFQSDVLRSLVFFDGLTGVYNRRYFDQQLLREWARSSRSGMPLSLIILDVDFFKRFNDHYGHQAGDDCLRQIADLLKNGLRRVTDMVARYGGEEFVCLLPDTPLDQAMEIARHLQSLVRSRAIAHQDSDVDQVVTISLGVACGIGNSGDAQVLLALADLQLYNAKNSGRGCTRGAELSSTPR
jgi:diguanylate cyclase (GGDEF)-like protein